MQEPHLPSWGWPCPCRTGVPGGDVPQPPGLGEAGSPLETFLPAWAGRGAGGVQSHTAASQAAGVMLGQWCQVPGGGPSLHSPLRAFVGSSDKLVRGAGRRPPPNRLSQKGEGNEGWVEGRLQGRLQVQQLCGKGGRGRPNPKEVLRDPLRWCPFHRPPGEPWTEGRWAKVQGNKDSGRNSREHPAFLILPTVGCLSTYCMLGTDHSAPQPPPDPSLHLTQASLEADWTRLMIPSQ